MHPVFRGLPYEVLLTPSSCTVASYGMTPRPYQVVQFRQFDDEGIVVVLEKGFRFESCSEYRLEIPSCLFLQ